MVGPLSVKGRHCGRDLARLTHNQIDARMVKTHGND
jgi:hypothetical protein